MKRNNKRGFTIVELVVVVAVIAILAAVLIPTFSGITARAKETALRSDLKAAYSQYVSEKANANEDAEDVIYIKVDEKYYTVIKGDTATAEGVDVIPACANDTEGATYVSGTVYEVAEHIFENNANTCKCGATTKE